jgi:hypothetical protein
VWSWFRKRRDAKREAEEEAFFDEWDERGFPDYDGEGNPIHPTWDEAARKWVYARREQAAETPDDPA